MWIFFTNLSYKSINIYITLGQAFLSFKVCQEYLITDQSDDCECERHFITIINMEQHLRRSWSKRGREKKKGGYV